VSLAPANVTLKWCLAYYQTVSRETVQKLLSTG
jgi:hypothetical protein